MQQKQITLSPGTTIQDRYVIEGLLGQGGFGAVYLVRDRRVKQNLYALKEVINPDKHDRERFIFEGELLKRLDHPALPRVYRVFERDKLKRVYMLMDYIRGRNLKGLRAEQAEQRFSLPVALAIMAPIVDALIYLHHQDPPVVHRDVKPANIIVPVGADAAVLVDFGSAKEYVADETTAIIRHGSPGYAALEQYGGGTTPRTDIYGLGATFYTLLTGTIPIDAITRVTRSKSRGTDPLKPVHLLAPAVPLPVSEAIGRAMALSSEDRFATVEEFWQVLSAHMTQYVQLPRVTAADTPQPLALFEQDTGAGFLQRLRALPGARKPRALLLALLALLLIVTIAMGLLFSGVRFDSSPPSVLHKSTPPSIPQSTATSTGVSPPSTLTPGPRYPLIASSYGGRIVDLLAKETTNMFLTNIRQSQGHIGGLFQGLGLVGSFTGTVTPAGHVLFTVEVNAENRVISFDGDIKIGGDIVGTFSVLDQGHFTGESGAWNIASNP